MSDLSRFYNHEQSAAMKLAFEKAWASMSFQYEPETVTGSRVKDMLAAVILELALRGERDPEKLSQMALRHLPPVVSYHAWGKTFTRSLSDLK
jgi:hypothetical protein